MQERLFLTDKEGMGSTRNGVDIAEEELRRILSGDKDNREARTTCREHLNMGFHNLLAMVRCMDGHRSFSGYRAEDRDYVLEDMHTDSVLLCGALGSSSAKSTAFFLTAGDLMIFDQVPLP